MTTEPVVVIHRDDKRGLILIEIDGRVAATVTLAAWSKALANPRKVPSYDFEGRAS